MKKIIVSALSLVISLCLLSNTSEAKKAAASSSSSSGIFSTIENAQHIFGPKVTQNDLKGKVVFLEYWGIHCPPCLASYPHLVKLQKEYEDTGKFTILASHMQNFTTGVTSFLTKQKVNFPVYQQFREPKAPCGRGIPHAALIDHTGKVVATGHPASLYSKVAALVKATPSGMIGDINIVYCKSQAKALESGKSFANTLKSLKRMSTVDGDKGKEAKAIFESATKYLKEKKDTLISKASTVPSVALTELTKFSKQINGLEYNSEVKAKIAELKTDFSLRKLIKFRKDIDNDNAKLAKKDSSSTRKHLERLKVSLQKFIDNASTTPAVAEEAKQLL